MPPGSRVRVRLLPALPMKLATILDEGSNQFALEYDSTVGRKNQTRLDAVTYEKAIVEARAYLSINDDDRDEAGDHWTVM
jgi:hypothetical protein